MLFGDAGPPILPPFLEFNSWGDFGSIVRVLRCNWKLWYATKTRLGSLDSWIGVYFVRARKQEGLWLMVFEGVELAYLTTFLGSNSRVCRENNESSLWVPFKTGKISWWVFFKLGEWQRLPCGWCISANEGGVQLKGDKIRPPVGLVNSIPFVYMNPCLALCDIPDIYLPWKPLNHSSDCMYKYIAAFCFCKLQLHTCLLTLVLNFTQTYECSWCHSFQEIQEWQDLVLIPSFLHESMPWPSQYWSHCWAMVIQKMC